MTPESASSRHRVLFAGDASARPAGLERELARAGFVPVELEGLDLDPVDLVLVALHSGDAAEREISLARARAGANVPLIALLEVPDTELAARLLDAGVADVMQSPVHLAELGPRLHARLRERKLGGESSLARAVAPLVEQAAGALSVDEVFQTIAMRMVHALGLARCEGLLLQPGERHARRVAIAPAELLGEHRLDLGAWDTLAAAVDRGEPVEVLAPPRPDDRVVAESANALAVPIEGSEHGVAVFMLVPRAGQHLSPAQVEFARELGRAVRPALDAEPLLARDERADPLTGLDRGRAFERQIQVELERARRYALGFAIVLLDVDGLSAVNAAEGTEAGDRLLRDIARLLLREVRIPDSVARVGGDEFALLLPETGLEGARTAIRRIRQRLGDPSGIGGHPMLTAGVVTLPWPDATQPDEAMALAESALLRAKALGGERIGTL